MGLIHRKIYIYLYFIRLPLVNVVQERTGKECNPWEAHLNMRNEWISLSFLEGVKHKFQLRTRTRVQD